QTRGADDEVVVRGKQVVPARAQVLAKARGGVHRDLGLHRQVRDRRARLAHAPCDGALGRRQRDLDDGTAPTTLAGLSTTRGRADVGAEDLAARPGALDGAERDAQLLRELARGRRGTWTRRSGSGRPGLDAVDAQARDRPAERRRPALADEDLDEDSVRLGLV